jgi:hypothetical protein
VVFEVELASDVRFCTIRLDRNGSRVAIATSPGASATGLESSTESSISVFDVETGMLIAELADEQVYEALPPFETRSSLSLYSDFSGDIVRFVGPSSSFPLFPILTWNIRTGEIADIGGRDSLSLLGDIRLPATGEIIFPDADYDNYPYDYCRNGGEGICPNVIRATTDRSVEASVIFHHSLYRVFSPIFAANGRYLLINVYVDATNDEELELYGYTYRTPRWIALDRTGRTFELPSEVPADFGKEPIGTPDGYIFLLQPPDAPAQLIHHRLTNDEVTNREVLWETTSSGFIRFLWWTELQGDPSLTPFNHMPPVVSDMPIIVPTVTPQPTIAFSQG